MTTIKVREMQNARPFQPFIIYIADGRAIKVSHPEAMAISPGGRTAVVLHKDATFDIIDLLLVTSLQVKPNGKTNGKGARH